MSNTTNNIGRALSAGKETSNNQPIAYTPEFVRLPVKGNCPYCHLSRPYLYQLINSGKIKTVSLRKPGNQRGVRLIHLESVLAFCRSQMA
jgi:hypothetical protein